MPFTGKAMYYTQDDKFVAIVPPADDVSDLVGLITPFDTPLLDMIGSPRYSTKTTRHEWFENELGAPEDKEKVRRENFTQIFTQNVTIKGNLNAVGLTTVEREFDYQVIQRLRELLRSLEQTVITGVPNDTVPGTETKRSMRGLVNMIQVGTYHANGEALTESMLNKALKLVHDKGGRPGVIVCGVFQKRRISEFNQHRRAYQSESTGLRNLADVYESDFGVQRVLLSRWVPSDKVLFLDIDKIQVLPLAGRSFQVKPLEVTDTGKTAQIIGEYTLEAINAADGGHGMITNLATA